jgi:Asp-tRNA(Asn)/Glu-tRNA(Gln) amidotransferase B subunit
MATVIVDNQTLADYYEAVSRASPEVSATDVGNWVTNDLLRLVKESGTQFDSSECRPRHWLAFSL